MLNCGILDVEIKIPSTIVISKLMCITMYLVDVLSICYNLLIDALSICPKIDIKNIF